MCKDENAVDELRASKNIDCGRILGSVVAIELQRSGYEVYVDLLYKKEIGFVTIKCNEKIYIQMSNNIGDKRLLEGKRFLCYKFECLFKDGNWGNEAC